MDEDINDAMEVFHSVRDHDYNELRNDIAGLRARVQAMNAAIEELSELENEIQGEGWAWIPEGDEEHSKREDLLIDILRVVDDGYLSSAWALRETLKSLKIDHASESGKADSLHEKYEDESRAVMGLRIYSHHGNSLPIRIINDTTGNETGGGAEVRQKIGVRVDDVWEKKGGEYHTSPDNHYGHLDTDFIHLPTFLARHFEKADGLVDEFTEVVLQENSDMVQDYQSIQAKLGSLLDSGAHNRY
ncbi:hypothetical protein [Halobacterium yunchengense]|uniref:hypothetical protein n=1 Tax=Halobacterium yunchengense TaxID=3108497 RepID=UPI00300946B7